jgi:hypothetical protein
MGLTWIFTFATRSGVRIVLKSMIYQSKRSSCSSFKPTTQPPNEPCPVLLAGACAKSNGALEARPSLDVVSQQAGYWHIANAVPLYPRHLQLVPQLVPPREVYCGCYTWSMQGSSKKETSTTRSFRFTPGRKRHSANLAPRLPMTFNLFRSFTKHGEGT